MIVDVLVKRLREFFKEERQLEYAEGSYGITSLLNCRKKAELRKQYSDIKVENVEIDNGFMFEFFVKKVLQDIIPESLFFPEFTFVVPFEDILVQPHIDVVLFGKQSIYSIEVKSVKKVEFEKLPREDVLTHDLVMNYSPKLPAKYIKQAQLQKFFLSKHLKGKKIIQLLLVSCLAVSGNNSKRVFLEYLVDDISEEEVKRHIAKWKTTYPLEPYECDYCMYAPYCSIMKKEVEQCF